MHAVALGNASTRKLMTQFGSPPFSSPYQLTRAARTSTAAMSRPPTSGMEQALHDRGAASAQDILLQMNDLGQQALANLELVDAEGRPKVDASAASDSLLQRVSSYLPSTSLFSASWRDIVGPAAFITRPSVLIVASERRSTASTWRICNPPTILGSASATEPGLTSLTSTPNPFFFPWASFFAPATLIPNPFSSFLFSLYRTIMRNRCFV